MEDAEEQRRVGAKESVLRNVNEGIERGHWPGEEDAPVGFRCECGRLGCNALIMFAPVDYERVRSDPRWFLVLPGHERPGTETVLERRTGYLVVEKRGEAGREAEERDPRA